VTTSTSWPDCTYPFARSYVIAMNKTEMVNPLVYKRINADIYHSQSPNLMSTAAMLGDPNKKHIITCRDPRTVKDWIIEVKDSTWKRRLRNIPLSVFEEGPVVRWTIKRADAVAYAAYYLKDKIIQMYKLKGKPILLPNIQDVPQTLSTKAKKPTVCFVGRLDKRKRPEKLFNLAKRFPNIQFLVMGRSEEKKRQKNLEREAEKIKNITMLGYLDKFLDKRFYKTYERAWILINTASREAHPLTFFEAASRGCAIMSHVNPDNWASRFGFWVQRDEYEKGLKYLLEKNRWKGLGKKAHSYVLKNYEKTRSVNIHINLYRRLLNVNKRNIKKGLTKNRKR